ncbi:hypothetical protein N9A28_02565 [Sulfurimonas sp.]|nr:hypothetical protein [Sulfurimonas sp.]
MFMLLFMIEDLLDLFIEIIEDILELNAPKLENTKKPPRLGR